MENTHTPESLATMQTPAAAAVPAEAQRRGRGKICGVKSVKPILHSLQACSRDYQHSLYQNKDLSIEDAVAVAQSLWLWLWLWHRVCGTEPVAVAQSLWLWLWLWHRACGCGKESRGGGCKPASSPGATTSLQPPHLVQPPHCNHLTRCKHFAATSSPSASQPPQPVQPPYCNHLIATTSLQPLHCNHLIRCNFLTWCKPTCPPGASQCLTQHQFTNPNSQHQAWRVKVTRSCHTHTQTHTCTHIHTCHPLFI